MMGSIKDISSTGKKVVISFDTDTDAEEFAKWMSGVLRTVARGKRKIKSA